MSDNDAAGWQSTGWFRAVLSDGTVWAESSDEHEVRERLEEVRTQAVTVYPPSGEKTYGPDPDASLEHLWERRQSEWRKCGVHDNCVGLLDEYRGQ